LFLNLEKLRSRPQRHSVGFHPLPKFVFHRGHCGILSSPHGYSNFYSD
jgi:hypothetical protein